MEMNAADPTVEKTAPSSSEQKSLREIKDMLLLPLSDIEEGDVDDEEGIRGIKRFRSKKKKNKPKKAVAVAASQTAQPPYAWQENAMPAADGVTYDPQAARQYPQAGSADAWQQQYGGEAFVITGAADEIPTAPLQPEAAADTAQNAASADAQTGALNTDGVSPQDAQSAVYGYDAYAPDAQNGYYDYAAPAAAGQQAVYSQPEGQSYAADFAATDPIADQTPAYIVPHAPEAVYEVATGEQNVNTYRASRGDYLDRASAMYVPPAQRPKFQYLFGENRFLSVMSLVSSVLCIVWFLLYCWSLLERSNMFEEAIMTMQMQGQTSYVVNYTSPMIGVLKAFLYLLPALAIVWMAAVVSASKKNQYIGSRKIIFTVIGLIFFVGVMALFDLGKAGLLFDVAKL